MLWLPQHKIAIQHVPRTGGTWLARVLGDAKIRLLRRQPKHLPFRDYEWPVEPLRRITVRRDADTWFRSWWQYCQQEGAFPWDEPPPFPPQHLPNPKLFGYEGWRAKISRDMPGWWPQFEACYYGFSWYQVDAEVWPFPELVARTAKLLMDLGVSDWRAAELASTPPINASKANGTNSQPKPGAVRSV